MMCISVFWDQRGDEMDAANLSVSSLVCDVIGQPEEGPILTELSCYTN